MKTIESAQKSVAVANEDLRHFENNQEGLPEVWSGEVNASAEAVQSTWRETFFIDALEQPIEEETQMTLPQTEDICDVDDRIRVDPKLYPNKLICRLIITSKNGTRYFGSGFFISPRCVITSGHCVHFPKTSGGSNYDWAQSIQVIPGADGTVAPFGSQVATVFRTVDGWAVNRDPNFDYGAIILPDETLFQRIQGFFGAKELTEPETLMNVGYPGDIGGALKGTAWGTIGPVEEIGEYQIKYMLDTFGGNSGSPVFVQNDGSAMVVGVHGYGSCPNRCVKVTPSVLQRWNEWKQL